MTHEQRVELTRWAFGEANRLYRNPGERGASPREYARFVAGQVLKEITINEPTHISKADAIEWADALNRGDLDEELAALMGYVG